VVKAIERAGQKAIAIQADAIDADAVAAAVEKTVAVFGRLDILYRIRERLDALEADGFA
jgi:3-oxoacyl-[acyl-carrier protein] reductase